MGELSFVGPDVPWGTAERAALDRCLAVPLLTEPARNKLSETRLSRTIEAEIIPRLMLAHRGGAAAGDESSSPKLTAEDVRHFTAMTLEQEAAALLAYVDEVVARGHSLDRVFLDLFSPTARLLGHMWRDDLLSFTDVTIGMSRLQQVVRQLSPGFEQQEEAGGRRGRILLAPAPGEQHSFGLSLLECFFRRAGWDVCGGSAQTRAELIRSAREEWLDVVGISLSADVSYRAIGSTISAVKKVSRNPSLFVMVGGRYFTDNPNHARQVGADAVGSDAPDALRQATSSLSIALVRC